MFTNSSAFSNSALLSRLFNSNLTQRGAVATSVLYGCRTLTALETSRRPACSELTSWGGDHVLELAGVLAGLQDHLCAAQHCLRGEGEGDVAREARAHAAVRQRLNHEEHVCGAAAGQARHRAQQLLVHLRPPCAVLRIMSTWSKQWPEAAGHRQTCLQPPTRQHLHLMWRTAPSEAQACWHKFTPLTEPTSAMWLKYPGPLPAATAQPSLSTDGMNARSVLPSHQDICLTVISDRCAPGRCGRQS